MEAENTIASFALALREGADVIEVDVRTTADGLLVAFHDENLGRMARDPRLVSALTFEGLSRIVLEGGGKVPLLDEVLSLGCPVMLDVKEAEAGTVVGLLDRLGARDRTCLCAFEHRFLARARELGATPLGYLIRPGTMFTEVEGLSARPGGLGFVLDPVGLEEMVEIETLRIPKGSRLNLPHFMMVNEPEFARKMVAHFHDVGVSINVWTVNDEEEARALASAGVDGIITDRPAVIVKALG